MSHHRMVTTQVHGEALHEGREDIFLAHHPAVEQGKTRARHIMQHERGSTVSIQAVSPEFNLSAPTKVGWVSAAAATEVASGAAADAPAAASARTSGAESASDASRIQ